MNTGSSSTAVSDCDGTDVNDAANPGRRRRTQDCCTIKRLNAGSSDDTTDEGHGGGGHGVGMGG